MGKRETSNNSLYTVRCLYGKGLVKAHKKAESQKWADTVIDQAIIDDLNKSQYSKSFKTFCLKYKIPYKKDIPNPEEYAFKLIEEINSEQHLSNFKNSVRQLFLAENLLIKRM